MRRPFAQLRGLHRDETVSGTPFMTFAFTVPRRFASETFDCWIVGKVIPRLCAALLEGGLFNTWLTQTGTPLPRVCSKRGLARFDEDSLPTRSMVWLVNERSRFGAAARGGPRHDCRTLTRSASRASGQDRDIARRSELPSSGPRGRSLAAARTGLLERVSAGSSQTSALHGPRIS